MPSPKLVLAVDALAKSDKLLAFRAAVDNSAAAAVALAAAEVALLAAAVALLAAPVAEEAAAVSELAALVSDPHKSLQSHLFHGQQMQGPYGYIRFSHRHQSYQ